MTIDNRQIIIYLQLQKDKLAILVCFFKVLPVERIFTMILHSLEMIQMIYNLKTKSDFHP